MQGTRTPIEASLIDRIVRGVKYVVTGAGPDAWFSPGDPLPPVAQDEAKGRAFDFPVGFNTRLAPRQEEGITFSQLRALADGYGLLRLVIETRKDQMARLRYTVKPIDPEQEPDDRCKAIEQFLRYPDQEHSWADWLRMLMEEMLVIDAATVYPRQNLGGGLYGLELIDGSTMRRVLDITGRTPLPPSVAFQQIIKGMPAVDYSRDELIYKPRNVRVHKVYGYSPVEQIIQTVNIALRRELYQLQYYTEGSVPDLIMQVPAEWQPSQIKEFSEYWQSLLAGNTANRARAMFVPAGVDPVDTKDKALHDEFDEWLARVVCYAFGVSHQALVSEVNRATAETAQQQALSEGLAPIMQWVTDLMSLILAKHFQAPDLCFAWAEEEDQDPLTQANIAKVYIDAKVLTPDEVRADIGRDPLTPEQREAAWPTPVMMPGMEGDEPGGPPKPPGAAAGEPDDKAGDDTAEKRARAQKKSPYFTPRLTGAARPSSAHAKP